MSTTQAVLITSTIFLFIIGAWPIAFITAIIFTVISILRAFRGKQNHDALKKENEALRQELADQAVRRAMDKAERREKKD